MLELNGAEFAGRIGKKTPNVHAYMSGKKSPGKKVLLSALRHAFEWDVTPVAEVEPVGNVVKSFPTNPGVYCLYDSSGSAIYTGQATNLKQEMSLALQRKMNFPVRLGPSLSKKAHPKYKVVATYIAAYEVPSRRVRHNLEALLLRAFPNQSHNNKLGRFQ